MLCRVEMDTGSMNRKQLQAKFSRYSSWAQSEGGKEYLLDLYRRYGATDPRPWFRLLVIAKDRGDNDERRVAEVLAATRAFAVVADRLWITSVADLQQHQQDVLPLAAPVWRKGRGTQVSRKENTERLATERATARDRNAEERLPLFPVEIQTTVGT